MASAAVIAAQPQLLDRQASQDFAHAVDVVLVRMREDCEVETPWIVVVDKAAVERQAAIERTRGMFAHLAPGQSLADDLIADRRAEARAEDREAAEETRRLRGK
jgi:hypothetical protein